MARLRFLTWSVFFSVFFHTPVSMLCLGRSRDAKQAISNRINVTACWLMEDDSYYSSYSRTAAAVDLAVSHVNDFILPANIHLNVLYVSTGPSCLAVQYVAMTKLLTFLQNDVTCDVFIGPTCPSTAVAIYPVATILQVPILAAPAAGASMLAVGSRGGFPLLVRAPFGFAQLMTALYDFLAMNYYTRVSFFRDDSKQHYQILSRYVYNSICAKNPLYSSTSREHFFMGDKLNDQALNGLLQLAQEDTRVFILMSDAAVVRRFMLAAKQMALTDEDHVFIAVELFPLEYWGTIRPEVGDDNDDEAREAYRNLLVLSLTEKSFSGRAFELAGLFDESIKRNAQDKYNYSFHPIERIDRVVSGHYEAIVMYAQEIARMQKAGLDFSNGTVLVQRILGSTYTGVVDEFTITREGERDVRHVMKAYNPLSRQLEVAMRTVTKVNSTGAKWTGKIGWRSPDGLLPADEPACGFKNQKCKENTLPPSLLAVAVVIPLLAIIVFGSLASSIILKVTRLRAAYDTNWWKIKTDDVIIHQTRNGSATASGKSLRSLSTMQSGYSSIMCDILGSYKGSLVSLTDVSRFHLSASSDLAKKIGVLKTINHINLHAFIGISCGETDLCEYVIEEVCSKGSLTDMLENETIKLDWSFKNSLVKDIVFGMTYLHSSELVSHGNLNSHVCLIDTRFTVKVSDYGLPFFRDPTDLQPPKETDKGRNFAVLLWRAPELLRQTCPPQGTQKGDVYSFGIILQQIVLRSGPFEYPNEPSDLSDWEILKEVIASTVPPARPRVPRAACSNELYDLMERCWDETPMERPAFQKIKDRLKKVIGDVGDNIVDLLFKRMEQYAADLELKVAEKTQQFMDEKNRSEQILAQLLPKSIAAALTRGEHVYPEAFESVTIFFSDIVGFTTISAAGSPMDVIALLNDLYTFFDNVLEKFDCYKVETIGDAYMVSSGLPVRNGNKHAAEIANMAVTLVKSIASFKVPHIPDQHLQIRSGISSGPCVAGMVGTKMPRYCLFGDTVNVASRMESTGEAMKIQISAATEHLLDSIGGFLIQKRGPVQIKGKGTLITYWLLGSSAVRISSGDLIVHRDITAPTCNTASLLVKDNDDGEVAA